MTTATNARPLEEIFNDKMLPALPHSAIALLQLSQSSTAGASEFARPIEADPGLMGQVLKFVNSSYFGFSREITSIQQALTLVGTRAITNFALWNAVFSVIPNPKFGPFDLKRLWQDSLRRALLARRLGKVLSLPEAEDLFAGALLQDMAIPLLLKELPEQYQSLLERRAVESRRLSGLEQECFGWDHADAAAMLAERWKLPVGFVNLIRNHTQLEELLELGPQARGSVCVALASLLPSCHDSQWEEQPLFIDAFTRLVGLTPIDLTTLLVNVDEDAANFAPLLRLPVPSQNLAQFVS
ncbi:MAG: HDOD domain-containing protein [Planctomycetaceae bacterium]